MPTTKFPELHAISFGLVVIISFTGFCGWSTTNAFSFDGSASTCHGVNVTGHPKVKQLFETCKKKTESTMNVTGMESYLCTALCVFTEDELVSTKTGKLVKSSIPKYKDIIDHMPEAVRANITQVFYNCFDNYQNDTVYNVTMPSDCSGAMYVGLCLKTGIDGVCNPEPEDEE